MRTRLILLLALFGATAGAQQTITHRFTVPDSATAVVSWMPHVSELAPGPKYNRWWHELADCERLWLPREYREIRFFQVNAVHFYDRDRPSLFWKDGILMVHWAIGQSFIDEGVIFLAIAYVDEETVVKHEMLHFLIVWNRIPPGEDLHPLPYFSTCGITVNYEPRKSG